MTSIDHPIDAHAKAMRRLVFDAKWRRGEGRRSRVFAR
jgi:hypothetical protein